MRRIAKPPRWIPISNGPKTQPDQQTELAYWQALRSVLYRIDLSPKPQLAGLPANWEEIVDEVEGEQLRDVPVPSEPAHNKLVFDKEQTPPPVAVTETSNTEIEAEPSPRSQPGADKPLALAEPLHLLRPTPHPPLRQPLGLERQPRQTRTHVPRTSRLHDQNIEDIEIGDTVVSYNETTGKNELKHATDAFDRVSDHLRILEIETADGEIQTLKTTDEHPFFTPHAGWVKAGDLNVGDNVIDHQRQIATVRRTSYEPYADGIAVYNFAVADNHTYYVAERGGAVPLFMHNSGCQPLAKIKRYGDRVYALVSSKGGVGPLRWHRVNRAVTHVPP